MRTRAKIDQNQSAVVKALRQCGCSVESLASVGLGVPDLLVGYRGMNYLLEVKDGEKTESRRSLTVAQKEWHEKWRGKVVIVTCVDEALRAVGALGLAGPSTPRNEP